MNCTSGFLVNVFLISLLIFKISAVQNVNYREKRYLIFPNGSSFMQMVLGFGLPFEVNKQSVTIGPFIKALYPYPTSALAFTNPSIDIDVDNPPIEEQAESDQEERKRKKRAAETRWNFYGTLSAAAQFIGYGGKACVLRAICETAEVPFSERAGIIAEMLHVIFTPSASTETVNTHLDYEYHAAEQLGRTMNNCKYLFPECKVNLMERFTQIFSHL